MQVAENNKKKNLNYKQAEIYAVLWKDDPAY